MNFIFIFSILPFMVNAHSAHHKHYKNEKPTTVSQFENHQDHAKFDHDALFGSSNEDLSQMSPDEAKKKLKQFILNNQIDSDQNGQITKDELQKWILNNFQSISIQDAADQLKEEDENNDGQISWDEHFKNNFNLAAEQTAGEKQMIFEDKELFVAADLNKDGLLDENEFPLFISPEDFPIMHETLFKLTMKRKDLDNDGLLSFDEYILNERGEMPDKTSESFVIDKDRFHNDLDKNKNHLLEKEEIMSWIIPDQNEIATDEAEHLINACDDNKDGKLTIDEIVNNYDVFLESEITEYGDKLKETHHDEL